MFNKIIFFIKSLTEKQIIFILFIICFALRLYAILMAQGIANDSAAYGFMARDFMKGNLGEALSIPGHPLYPLLISFLSPNPSNVEIVGRLISLFFGAITFFIIYYLIKKEIGQKEALLTLLFYTFHPYLVTYSGMMLTEAMYGGLLVLSIYFFWTGLKSENIWKMIPAGIFLGLSYLTRPEGIGYIFVYFIWIIVIVIIKNKGWLKGLLQIVLVVFFTFIVASPYILYIHKETGQWLITKKALAFQSLLLNKDIELKKDTSNNATKKIPLIDKENNPGTKDPKSILIVKNIIFYFPFVIYHYLRALHFSLWIFLFFGLVRFKEKIISYELFVSSIIIFHLISLSCFTKSTIRFSVPIVPISLFFVGIGVLEIEGFLRKIYQHKSNALISLLIIIALIAQLPQSLKPERRHRKAQKEVGLWIKANTPKDSKVLSNSPIEAFYSEREFVLLLPGVNIRKEQGESLEDIITFAKQNGVRYIIINEEMIETNLDFIKINKMAEIKEIYQYKNKKNIIVYEVKN